MTLIFQGALLHLSLIAGACASFQDAHRDPRGFFVGDRPKALFSEGTLTEGPAQGPDGLLYFCDITPIGGGSNMEAGHIWRLDLSSREAEIFRSPSGMASGLLFDHRGRLVATQGANFGGRAVIRTDMASGRTALLAMRYAGRRFNAPNDLAIDVHGRLYFTDPRSRRTSRASRTSWACTGSTLTER